MKESSSNVTFVHQDHLTGTSVMSDNSGTLISSIAYAPFGETRSGSVSTDIKFTGQRLDNTGLYYYGARYYDPSIGRFLSSDSIAPDLMNPQSLNRYSYVLNNPLKYNDPSGSWPNWADLKATVGKVINAGNEALQVTVSKTVEFYQTAIELPSRAQEATMHAVGIEYVTTYTDTNLMLDPVPVYHVGDEGIVPSLLGKLSGISIYPIGTFVKESALVYDPSITEHESFHYSDQAELGIINWTAAYYGEMLLDWAYYGGDYWEGPYNVNSQEMEARDYAGQPIYPYQIPDPWWQDPAESFMETIVDYYDDWYYYDGW